MSRIGRLPISIPAGVDVKIDGQAVSVKGPKGELALVVKSPIEAKLEEGTVVVTRPDDERESRPCTASPAPSSPTRSSA